MCSALSESVQSSSLQSVACLAIESLTSTIEAIDTFGIARKYDVSNVWPFDKVSFAVQFLSISQLLFDAFAFPSGWALVWVCWQLLFDSYRIFTWIGVFVRSISWILYVAPEMFNDLLNVDGELCLLPLLPCCLCSDMDIEFPFNSLSWRRPINWKRISNKHTKIYRICLDFVE